MRTRAKGDSFKHVNNGGAWVAQSVECWTSDFGSSCDLRGLWDPAPVIGLLVSGESAWGSLPLLLLYFLSLK